jgi:hypothetical protein
VLCARLGDQLPGKNTVPEQISSDKTPYYRALEAADEEWKGKKVDLSVLEKLLSDLLANQLVFVHERAVGGEKTTGVVSWWHKRRRAELRSAWTDEGVRPHMSCDGAGRQRVPRFARSSASPMIFLRSMTKF